MLDYLLADLERKRNHYFLEDTFFEKYVKTTLQLGTLAAFYYRFGHWSATRRNPVARLLSLFIYYLLSPLIVTVTQVHINPRLLIGKGFIIHNFSNVVIDAEAVGENFTVNQGVSVGPDWQGKGKPTLGDNVFIGSGAKVLGAIIIGNNVVVAANSLVNKSIPDNCTVAGVPARIISRDATSNYLHLGTAPKTTHAQPTLSAVAVAFVSMLLAACGGSHAPGNKSSSSFQPVPDTACGQATIAATASSSDIRFIDPVNLSDAGGLSEHPSIATGPNGRVYVAWDDDKELNKDVYLRISQDYGNTYSDYYNVSNTGAATVASIGVDSNQTIYAAWQDVSSGPSEIFFARKQSGDAQFSTATQISDVNASTDTSTQSVDVFLVVAPATAAHGAGNIYIAWADSNQTTHTYAVKVATSTDGGAHFSTISYTPPQDGTGASNSASTVTLHVDADGNIHMAWAESTTGNRLIKYAKSTDQGATFSAPVTLATATTLLLPSITTEANNSANVYVGWTNEDTDRINFTASHDGGQSFSAAFAVFDTSVISKQLSVRLASGTDGTIYASWTDNRTGNYETTFAKSSDHGATFSAPVVFSPSAQGSLFTAIAVDAENNVYIGVDDNRYSNPPDTPEEIGDEGNFEILVARGKQGLPAVQSASASPCPITPNGDKDADTTTFTATFSESLDWSLTVLAPDGTTVAYQQSGTGSSINLIWDGTSNGAVVADGIYTYKITGVNGAGVVSTSASGSLVVYTATAGAAPQIKSFAREAFGFSPNNDGFKDSDGISAEFNKPVNWTVTVKDSNDVAKRTLTGSGIFIDSEVTRWDGKDDNGNILPEADYSLNLSVIDGRGQKASCGRQPIVCLNMEIDTTKPFINDLALNTTSIRTGVGGLTVSGVPEELSLVTIYIYNKADVLVRKVDRNFRDADTPFSVTWDGLNSNSQPVLPGSYRVWVWCRDRSGNTATTYPYKLDFTITQ